MVILIYDASSIKLLLENETKSEKIPRVLLIWEKIQNRNFQTLIMSSTFLKMNATNDNEENSSIESVKNSYWSLTSTLERFCFYP